MIWALQKNPQITYLAIFIVISILSIDYFKLLSTVLWISGKQERGIHQYTLLSFSTSYAMTNNQCVKAVLQHCIGGDENYWKIYVPL